MSMPLHSLSPTLAPLIFTRTDNSHTSACIGACHKAVLFLQGDDQRPMKDWVLTKESELRLEVLGGESVDLKVCLVLFDHGRAQQCIYTVPYLLFTYNDFKYLSY